METYSQSDILFMWHHIHILCLWHTLCGLQCDSELYTKYVLCYTVRKHVINVIYYYHCMEAYSQSDMLCTRHHVYIMTHFMEAYSQSDILCKNYDTLYGGLQCDPEL